jgi:hypothetical protein
VPNRLTDPAAELNSDVCEYPRPASPRNGRLGRSLRDKLFQLQLVRRLSRRAPINPDDLD